MLAIPNTLGGNMLFDDFTDVYAMMLTLLG